jgi:ferredoxin-nitrite reductase
VELARSLDSHFKIDQPINLHVTGCSNSCAQHYIGDIGLMGVKVAGEEGYQVNLGGGSDQDQGVAREMFPGMKYAEVVLAMHRLFTRFNTERGESESFLEFTRRHTVEQLRAMCLEVIQ